MDAVYALKNGRFLVMKKSLFFMIIISAGFWCIFELINLRIKNWFYINLPEEMLERYLGYFLSYGTVIPAIYVTKEVIQPFIGKIKTKKIYFKNYPNYAISIGFFMLLLTLLFPEFFFGLAWVFFGLILDGYNYKKGYRSFAGDLEMGNATDVISSMLGGLFCGILWEFWNNWAVTKWIYTVPFFEDIKIFEMPVLGYMGFMVFGLETIAFVNFLEGIWWKWKKKLALTFIMAFLGIFTFYLIDRYTVFSFVARTYEIDFIDKERIETFKSMGIKTSYKIDIEMLDRDERELLDLMHLKGLGFLNLKKLIQNNIRSTEDLSLLDENTLSRILHEDNMRRVRVYLKAAKNKNAPNKGRF